MIRPVRPDGSIETGGTFVPIFRPRIVERISSAALARIALVIAPAGYGKSVALSHYLQRVESRWIRYDVLAHNAGLLGFLRGLSDAVLEIAPDARTTLAGAYEKNAESESPGVHLALWMHTHVRGFRGTIAIDDLHVAQDDREVMRFLTSLIERTKGHVSWILSSRSTAGLPIGTWLAYGESDLAVDDHDLRFSLVEAREAARSFKLAVGDQELNELLNLTDGWPTALSFALRSSTRSVDLRSISTMTREMVYHYLAEQVYHQFDEEELAFIEAAALLPEIDIAVMAAAGFDRAAAMVDELRARVAFVYESQPGVFRLHDLFRDFVLHELDLRGAAQRKSRVAPVARALESMGRIAESLHLFGRAGDVENTKRLLSVHGISLLNHGYADDVAFAISKMPADLQDDNVRGIEGALALRQGGFERGERLVTRSLAGSVDAPLRGELTLRLAMHQSNRGIDPIEMLEALSRDPNADERVRAEAQGLLAFSYARSGDQKRARELVSSLTKVCALQDDEVAATLFLRLGNTALLLGDTAKCRDLLSRAVNAAASQGLWAAASRAHRSLALAHRRSENESGLILWHGQQASLAATRAGDYYDLQMSLLLLLSLETQRGDGAAAAAIEKQLGDLQRSDAEIIPYLRLSQGHRYAWDGKFGDAHRVFGTVKGRQPQLADRALIHSLYALCLILDGADDESAIAASDALRAIAEAGRDEVLVGVAALIVALSDILAGRFTVARRALRSWKRSSHEMVDALVSVAEELLAAAESPTYEAQDVDLNLGAVRVFGYGGFARYFELTAQEIVRRRIPSDAIKLTPAEVRILRALADGRSPKTIAADMNRSVLTIQTHIQNIAKKLGGHGRADTIAVARKLGLL